MDLAVLMETKTERVRRLIMSGNWKPALSILRTFRFEFTRSQKRLIEISSDVLNGNGRLYEDLGIDVAEVLKETKVMLQAKYCR